MTIGIICATKEEAAGFIDGLEAVAPRAIGPLAIHYLSDGEEAIILAISGMGKVNAAIAAVTLIQKYRCGTLVVCGVAGRIQDMDLANVGIVVECAQHDYGVMLGPSEFLMVKPGTVKSTDSPNFLLDQELEERLNILFAGRQDVFPAKLASGDAFLAVARSDLPSRLQGYHLVDMETAAIAQVAEAFGARWLAIRSVSDSVSEASVETFEAEVTKAGVLASDIVLEILQADIIHPK